MASCALLLVLAAVLALAAAAIPVDFDDFAVAHKKTYLTREEHDRRRTIFEQNMERAAELAILNPLAQFGPTRFSDLTPGEFAAQYLTANISRPTDISFVPEVLPRVTLPSKFDWRDRGAVTSVFDQGACGSCYAVASAENIESVVNISQHQPLRRFSMQQLVDCDSRSSGCNGGDPVNSFRSVIAKGGIEAYSTYPYTGRQSSTCRYLAKDRAANITGWTYATQNRDEARLKQWLYANAPPVVCIDASTWQTYRGGILTNCHFSALDHCVQLTGWNDQWTVPAWIVRNSWGTDWGDNGYIYLAQNQDACGITREAVSATVQ